MPVQSSTSTPSAFEQGNRIPTPPQNHSPLENSIPSDEEFRLTLLEEPIPEDQMNQIMGNLSDFDPKFLKLFD